MKLRNLMVALYATAPMLGHAGGILTNTNQHVNFLRMIARGTTSDIDAVYSNPAGLAWLNHNGWTLSFNVQNAAQHRDIHARYTLFNYSTMQQGLSARPTTETFTQYYGGRASAPIIPSFYAAYQHDRLTFSADAALVGGGGKASYDDGLPMFDSAIRFALANNAALSTLSKAVGASTNAELYNLNTAMSGSQYIYGVQIGVTYKATDWLSTFLGGRMNYFSGNYRGFVAAVVKEQFAPYYQTATGRTDRNLYNLELDCDQTGWGIMPIIGLAIKKYGFTLGVKYEFMTNLNLENQTKRNTDPNGALAAFAHGVNTPNDVPAMLSTALGYDFLPTLRATAEYHHYYDKQAGMAAHKEQYLTHGTDEYALGIEWNAIPMLTVSAGAQITDYGLSDRFQTDTSFSCDSYSVGFGASFHIKKNINFNLAYFWTTYSDYDKQYTNTVETAAGAVPSVQGINTYSRTNKVFGVGIDYRF